jgi:hypothetical protein
MIKRFYHYDVEFEYDGLPILKTSMGDRKYQPDIWVSDTDHKKKKIYLGIVEIDGKIHAASKHQLSKTKLRRESITDYFITYSDRINPDYEVIFSYTVFEPDDFLYNKIDYFLETFENNFRHSKHHPHRSVI